MSRPSGASRDDMVIRVRLRKAHESQVRERNRDDNVRARLRKRLEVRKLAHRRYAMSLRGVRGAGASLGNGIGGIGRVARFANPAGLLLGAIAAGVVVATRLISGRSFENMGQQMRHLLLGDTGADAIASRQARERLTGDPDVARMVAREQQVGSQVSRIYRDLHAMEMRDQLGRELIERDPNFQTNNIADMLILRARDKIVEGWKGAGGPHAFASLQRVWGERTKVRAR